MAENYIGLKLPPEMRAGIITRAEMEGITASEWIRAIISRELDSETPSVDAGYQQARRLATQMAQIAIRQGLASLPESYGEWIALLDENGMPLNGDGG